jgi:hypothetical protein
MPLLQMIYLVGVVVAFTIFGATLAVCRAVSSAEQLK